MKTTAFLLILITLSITGCGSNKIAEPEQTSSNAEVGASTTEHASANDSQSLSTQESSLLSVAQSGASSLSTNDATSAPGAAVSSAISLSSTAETVSSEDHTIAPRDDAEPDVTINTEGGLTQKQYTGDDDILDSMIIANAATGLIEKVQLYDATGTNVIKIITYDSVGVYPLSIQEQSPTGAILKLLSYENGVIKQQQLNYDSNNSAQLIITYYANGNIENEFIKNGTIKVKDTAYNSDGTLSTETLYTTAGIAETQTQYDYDTGKKTILTLGPDGQSVVNAVEEAL